MLVVVAPRSARGMDLDQLQDVADRGEMLISASERARLQDALLSADPGLILESEADDQVVLRARGRSGLTLRLGPVWHEVELPDWHEGSAGTWLADRFVSLLRIFPRICGGTVHDPHEGHALDPAAQAELVQTYRYRVQAGPDAPMLPILDLADDQAEAFAELAEPVLRRRGASAADRAWFFAQAAMARLDQELPDAPVEVRYAPTDRRVEVMRYDDQGEATPLRGRLAPGVLDDPPELPSDLTDKGKDPEAVRYLAGLLTWA